MAKLAGEQLSLIAESEFDERPVGDWDYDDLGTKNYLVPNSPTPKLGTKKFLVPKSPMAIAWEEKYEGQYIEDWKPKIGGLELKWVGKYRYWYWRYYDINGKKASIYLHKDYNKAVRKAIKIGVPTDAKLPKSAAIKADNQTQTRSGENLIDIAQTAYGASRTTRAA